MAFEVPSPILCSPYTEPDRHWFIPEGASPVERGSRRPAFVFQPRDGELTWDLTDGTLARLPEYDRAWELTLVNRIRARVAEWRAAGYPNATGTSIDLLAHWRRDGRRQPLFFAQLEAVETVLFLVEGRADLRQGITVPLDEPTDDQLAAGARAFARYACKMATGSGKTTVMGMLAAWSILNKVVNRADARFSDLVLIVCPNVTIRDRLRELDVDGGDASLYRTRDLVPAHLMPRLAQGRVVVTNWHVFEPRTQGVGGDTSRVSKIGKAVTRTERVYIGDKSTVARGERYLTLADYTRLAASGEIEEVEPPTTSGAGERVSALVRWTRYVESDASIVARVLGRAKGKQNILVLNDEAHHAYRIRRDDDDDEAIDLFGDEEQEQEYVREATVWIEGLDRVNALRGINLCVDLSATPYYLGRMGRDSGRPFPWLVSDFGLTDAIESGLVKVPQLAVRDNTGAERPKYHNLWRWIMSCLTPAERGGRRGSPKVEAVLKWAHTPLVLVAQDWERVRTEWAATEESRPPVLIIVCRDTKLAKAAYEWIAEEWSSVEVPPFGMPSLRNVDGVVHTIRVDSKVVSETDSGAMTSGAQGDLARWMRFTLDTVGRREWPTDSQGRPVSPPDFDALAQKLERPLHPPGRDVRCIVSVGMLTEGWDANTVTHVVGLRPFQSQLLCEQVVGRALRRASYDVEETDAGPRFRDEVAQVLGVPFEIIPFKASGSAPPPPSNRRHVRALPERSALEIRFPKVDGYTQAVRNRVAVDWDVVPDLVIDPANIPPEVFMAGVLADTAGKVKPLAPAATKELALAPYLATQSLQQRVFIAAGSLTRRYIEEWKSTVPAHVLFPQIARIVQHYADTKVRVIGDPKDVRAAFIAPYYSQLVERILQSLQPDDRAGETPEVPRFARDEPGTSAKVDFWTGKDVRDTVKSHVNYLVADTKRWEQQAAQYLDGSPYVTSWVKNAGLGFGIPYEHDSMRHEYLPDFIVRLVGEQVRHVIVETKGYDPLADVKRAAAERWVRAVNADGSWGEWHYRLVYQPADLPHFLAELCPTPAES
ncbi:BPTD_3080 family restriction endonuclease [Gemmatimonas sp.]|uniref:BPTD_3080 family restriction endonuclease n=1 Tax=Gemmatimonas sp. TaxID=1962908 RepID=UPI003DA283B3